MRRALLAAAALVLAAAAAESLARLGAWLEARRAPAEDGVYELYAVGDSTAFGEPYGAQANLAAMTAARLDGRALGLRFAPVLLAQPGATARAQLLALKRRTAARDPRRPGAALIYVGHNDRTLFDVPAGPFSAVAAALERRSLAAGALAQRLARERRLVPHRDPAQYEADLSALVDAASSAGLLPVLMTCASNLADADPRPLWDGLSREQARSLLENGARLERSAPEAARRLYADAAERQPALAAYADYRLGALARRAGRWDEARALFARAVELGRADRFGRASPAQNDAVRRIAASRGLPLVDAARLFEAASPHGLVGAELFSDGHHPNLRGRRILADAAARALSERLGARLLVPREPREDTAAALVYSGKWWLAAAAEHLRPGLRTGTARRRFTAALARSPGDFEACFGLALLRLEDRAGWLDDGPALAWFRERGIQPFVSDDYAAFSARAGRTLEERFRAAGLPPPRCR